MRTRFLIFVCGVALVGLRPHTAVLAQELDIEMVSVSSAAEAWIRPGDQVVVRIVREPEMSGTYTVSDAGEIVLPRLGRMMVTELTPRALQDTVLKGYEYFLRNPSVEVSVLRRVAVHGEVRRPDVYLVDLTTTLRDLLAKAGGITETGNPNRIMVVREGEQIRFDRYDSATLVAAELRSGDQIVVGRRSWASLNALGIISTSAVAVSVFVPLIRSLLR